MNDRDNDARANGEAGENEVVPMGQDDSAPVLAA